MRNLNRSCRNGFSRLRPLLFRFSRESLQLFAELVPRMYPLPKPVPLLCRRLVFTRCCFHRAGRLDLPPTTPTDPTNRCPRRVGRPLRGLAQNRTPPRRNGRHVADDVPLSESPRHLLGRSGDFGRWGDVAKAGAGFGAGGEGHVGRTRCGGAACHQNRWTVSLIDNHSLFAEQSFSVFVPYLVPIKEHQFSMSSTGQNYFVPLCSMEHLR